MSRSATEAPSPAAGPSAPAPRPRRPRRARRLALLAAPVIAALALLLLVAQRTATAPTVQPPSEGADTCRTRLARGQVRPVAQARVGALSAGVLLSLSVDVGDAVVGQQEIARVRGASSTDVVMAPFRGTVTGLLVNVGDTLAPGAIIATVGDLTRLQVETTEVDEFLVPCVRPGQRVVVLVDALRERELAGIVRTVALEPRVTATGDEHYPVTIELPDAPPELRPGMTVRVRFGE